MNGKKANWLFLVAILSNFMIVVLAWSGVTFGPVLGLLSGQFTFIPPVLLYLLIRDRSVGVRKELGFCRLRISTALLSVLYTMLLMPLVTVVNAISMLWVDNTVAAMSGELLGMSFAEVFLAVAVIAPLCEETVFRGIFFNAYRNDGSTLGAALLSAFLFGVMHLNLNQMGYAIVIGTALALLMVATGSIWAPILGHMYVNAQSVCMMFVAEYLLPGSMQASAESLDRDTLLMGIGIYAVVAVVTTSLAACLLVWMAHREGRGEAVRQLCRKPENSGFRITIPLAAALLIAAAFILWHTVMQLR
ncbi:MAG: CPBP family intramembrane metalloprotease [Lachnospiraceae bacterium]|nr:CPBP family intramembrane metalloprotease [Lachnospiraceae bacterium]